MNEGRTIQHQATRAHRNQNKDSKQNARIFAKLMMEGRVRAALRLIANDDSNGPLCLDSLIEPNNPSNPETVREVLKKKHPPKQPGKPSAITTPGTPTTQPHPILFNRIDGDLIRNTALKTDGAAGPSGLDATAWKRLCNSFKSASTDLCDAVAATARRMCTCYVDPDEISALVACHLIALHKNSGVKPIGIGETVRRIIGRAIVTTISEDIQAAAEPLRYALDICQDVRQLYMPCAKCLNTQRQSQ